MTNSFDIPELKYMIIYLMFANQYQSGHLEVAKFLVEKKPTFMWTMIMHCYGLIKIVTSISPNFWSKRSCYTY